MMESSNSRELTSKSKAANMSQLKNSIGKSTNEKRPQKRAFFFVRICSGSIGTIRTTHANDRNQIQAANSRFLSIFDGNKFSYVGPVIYLSRATDSLRW